ncbi:MAG: DNA recombination protein RmuC, partial [Alphaproteobacteria bacterium]|nr:DNA recombination protein RmuC [Alphaproteobacteria bacterium]
MNVLFALALVMAALGSSAAFLLYRKLVQADVRVAQAVKERDSALQAQGETDRKLAQAEQKLFDFRERMADWEAFKKETLNAVQAATVKTSNEISNKLLEDHKREAEVLKKETEERTKQTTTQLTEEFKVIVEKVAALKVSDEKQDKTLGTLWRTLSTPSGAGELAEIGLENALKNLGLEPGRDFIMQYSLAGHEEGSRLRPDCLVFLPRNHVMVIDSKASKFVLEIAQAQTEEEHKNTLIKFARSMNEHLRSLASKDYEGAVRNFYKAAGRGESIDCIISVMYVPNETAYAHMRQADPDFLNKVQIKGMTLASPTTLLGLLSLAKLQLIQEQQAQNQKVIVETMETLLDGLTTMFDHIGDVGKSLKNASKAFNNFAGSAN